MVYCGKPSRGCQMCRTRRIKCDETKPTCMQCQKSRRQCPGYKDDFDLVFRNETQATERRARRSVGSRKGHAHIILGESQMSFVNTGEGNAASLIQTSVLEPSSDPDSPRTLSIREGISIPIEEQAPCYFISNFVMIPQSGSSRGYFDFLAPMIKAEEPDSHLSVAFSAVALASLANRPNSKSSGLMQQAISQYAKALKAINSALQSPLHQKSDQTLAAIVMLGFFETVTSERTNVMAWGSHVGGAVQLVRMRGKKQLRTKIGHALFISVRAQMTIQCMAASKAPYGDIEWWIADAVKDEKTTITTKLNLQVAELRNEVNNALASFARTPENFQKVLNLMKRAQALEQEYLAWMDTLLDIWLPKTVAWVDNVPDGDIMKADVCPGKVDIYEDIWMASVWNQARVARLFIAGVVVRCAAWICSPVDYRTTPEYATAARLCSELVADIIASIPFHLGWRLNQRGDLTPGDFSGFACGTDNIASPKALGGFFCMWPLFCVSCMDYTSDSQRQWIQGRLNWITDTMGLNQARVLGSFQLRLPSMIIRRDSLGHSPPSAALLAAAAARGYSLSSSGQTDRSTPITSATIANLATATSNPHPFSYPGSIAKPTTTPSPQPPVYALNPLQQREAMQREAWEKERKALLRKASNGNENNVERILAGYLAV